jgi:hypothetical protein
VSAPVNAPNAPPISKFTQFSGDGFDYDLPLNLLSSVNLNSAQIMKNPTETVDDFLNRMASICITIGKPNYGTSPGCSGFVVDTSVTQGWLKGWNNPTGNSFNDAFHNRVSFVLN